MNPGAMGESALRRILEATFSPELLIIHWEFIFSIPITPRGVSGSGGPGVYGRVSWGMQPLPGDHEEFC